MSYAKFYGQKLVWVKNIENPSSALGLWVQSNLTKLRTEIWEFYCIFSGYLFACKIYIYEALEVCSPSDNIHNSCISIE